MKPVRFMGSAKDDLSAFPKPARVRAGHEQADLDLARQRYRDARDHAEGANRG